MRPVPMITLGRNLQQGYAQKAPSQRPNTLPPVVIALVATFPEFARAHALEWTAWYGNAIPDRSRSPGLKAGHRRDAMAERRLPDPGSARCHVRA